MLFSQRKGLKPARKAIQREEMDSDLRNRLWSALSLGVWDRFDESSSMAEEVTNLALRMWVHYFKRPSDTLPNFHSQYRPEQSGYGILRTTFFASDWAETYDYVEYVIKQLPEGWSENVRKLVNRFLEEENAAYRFVGNEIVEITDAGEVAAIESAMDRGVSSSRTHMRRAVELLSDRRNPDYRNAVKEAISAVEATCQALTGNSKATLGDALKLIRDRVQIHPSFEQALQKLYGFTSDEGGIRHSLSEQSVAPTYADAKFMVVAASAFNGYLMTKAAEANIRVPK